MSKRAADWIAFLAALWCFGCSQAIQPTEIIAASRTGDRFHDCIVVMLETFAEAALYLEDTRSRELGASGGDSPGASIAGGRGEGLSYEAGVVAVSFEEFALITSVCAMTEEDVAQLIESKMVCADEEGCEFILDTAWIYEAALEIRKEQYVD